MVDTKDYTWESGDDGEVAMIYKTKATDADPLLPVDLTGYSLRMDIATQTGDWVWTFNSEDIVVTPSVDSPGIADNEAQLSPNGLIFIVVPRVLTLPGGKISDQINLGNLAFNYDVFLRSPLDKQKKILKGVITINSSVTKWV